jgi:hypothetical protein
MFGGEIAYLQGGARVYRFSGAEHPNDIALINEELANQKENKALARLMPSTNIPRAKSPVRTGHGTAKQLKRSSKSPTNTTETSGDFDREPSPFTAELRDPTYTNPAKRPRLETNIHSIPGNNLSAKTIADIRTQNLALAERNEMISAKVHDLNRANGYLQTELTSTKTLWTATSKELTTLRAQYLESQEALRMQADGQVNAAGLQAVKNDLTIYRNLAMNLYSKLQTSADTIQKGVTAVNGVKRLAEELGFTPKDEVPMVNEYGTIKRDLEKVRESMKAVLGEEWGKFEREVMVEKES